MGLDLTLGQRGLGEIAIGFGGERSQVEGVTADRREPSEVAIGGGGERSDGGERLEVEKSARRWRGAIRGGGERSEVEGSDRLSLLGGLTRV